MHKFFPVHGIILGETTIEEVKRQGLYESISYDDGFNEIDYYDENGYTTVKFEDCDFQECPGDNAITWFSWMFNLSMPPKWRQMGFGLRMSYNEWIDLFRSWGYNIQMLDEPHKGIRGEEDGKFSAYAPDDTIKFVLKFCGSLLFSMHVYSHNSYMWD